MSKTLRKWLSLATVTLLLAGCGSGGGDSADKDSAKDDTKTTEVADSKKDDAKEDGEGSDLPEPGDFSDEVELTLSASFTKGRVEDDNWVQKRLEDQFNVKITNVKVDTWDSNETSIMVAADNLPDTFAFTGGGLTDLEFYEQGLTRTIPRWMIEKYAPKYAEMLDTEENGIGWELKKAPDKEDEYISLVGWQSHTEGIIWAPTLRMDWMENLGIPIPEDAEPIGDSDGYERIYMTEHAYTIDELEEILTKFTFDDPDGNGKDDTYGLLPYNNNNNWGQTLYGAFGIAPHYNLEEDGELKTAVISDGYRQALETFSDWYKKGIVDPEWTTMTEQLAWEKYQTGKIGYSIAQRTYLAQEAWTKGRAPHNILDADPNAKLLVTQPEIGPDGKQGEATYMPVTLYGDSLKISSYVTDEQLARYLQMFDFIHHDPEGVWTTYGIPGEHSQWAGEEGKSTLIVNDEYDLEEGEMGFWAYSFRTYPGDRFYWLSETKTIELMDKFFAVPEIVEKMGIRPHRNDLFNQTDYAEVSARYGGQLGTIVDEFRIKAMTGEVDFSNDKEWDAYVEDYLNNGGRELLEELEKAPLVEDLLNYEPGMFD